MKHIRTVVEVIFTAAAVALLLKTATSEMGLQEKIVILLIVLVAVGVVVFLHKK